MIFCVLWVTYIYWLLFSGCTNNKEASGKQLKSDWCLPKEREKWGTRRRCKWRIRTNNFSSSWPPYSSKSTPTYRNTCLNLHSVPKKCSSRSRQISNATCSCWLRLKWLCRRQTRNWQGNNPTLATTPEFAGTCSKKRRGRLWGCWGTLINDVSYTEDIHFSNAIFFVLLLVCLLSSHDLHLYSPSGTSVNPMHSRWNTFVHMSQHNRSPHFLQIWQFYSHWEASASFPSESPFFI